MATSSTSAHVKRFHYVQQSLRQVQLRWFVAKHQIPTSVHDDDVDDDKKGDVGGRLTLQVSIIDQSGTMHTEWIRQRAVRENVEEFYDVPLHLLHAGHQYEFNVKVMSRDQSSTDDNNDSSGLMKVVSTKTLNFRAGIHLKL